MTIKTKLKSTLGFVRVLIGLERYAQVRDISLYQPSFNSAGLKTRGVGLMIRAGQNVYVDPRFWEHYNQALNDGVPFGIWWFWQPDAPFQPQLDAFLLLYRSLPWKPPIVALDVEDIALSDGTHIFPASPADHTANLLGWLRGVEAATGNIPGIYTRQNYWDAWTIAGSGFDHFWLWVATWTKYSTNIIFPRDWAKTKSWLLWQYEGGDGRDADIPGPVDLDAYNGDPAKMAAWFAGEGSPPSPNPTPTPFEPYKVQVTSSFLTVCATPDPKAAGIAWLKQGDIVEIVEVSSNNWGRFDEGWISLYWTTTVIDAPPEPVDELTNVVNWAKTIGYDPTHTY